MAGGWGLARHSWEDLRRFRLEIHFLMFAAAVASAALGQWPEAALLLVLFVTAFGVAVGVRDAGHIGLESLVVLLPEKWQHRIEVLIHALVALFGFLMVQGGWLWASAKWDEKKPMLPVPDGIDYVPVIIAGALIFLFSIEHIVALLRGEVVEPVWD